MVVLNEFTPLTECYLLKLIRYEKCYLHFDGPTYFFLIGYVYSKEKQFKICQESKINYEFFWNTQFDKLYAKKGSYIDIHGKNEKHYKEQISSLIRNIDYDKLVMVASNDLNAKSLRKYEDLFRIEEINNKVVCLLKNESEFTQKHYDCLKKCSLRSADPQQIIFIQCHTKKSLFNSMEYEYHKKEFFFDCDELKCIYMLDSKDDSDIFSIFLRLFRLISDTKNKFEEISDSPEIPKKSPT